MHHDSWINNTKCIEYVEEKTELSECLKKLSHAEILNAIPDTWIDTSPPSNWGIPGFDFTLIPRSFLIESYSITPQAPLLIADGKLVVSQLNRTVVNDIFGNFKAIDIAIGFTAEEVDSDPMDILVGYNDKEFSAFLEAKYAYFSFESHSQVPEVQHLKRRYFVLVPSHRLPVASTMLRPNQQRYTRDMPKPGTRDHTRPEARKTVLRLYAFAEN